MSENSLMRLINSRRSIRKYELREVEDSKIAACIEAARLAPSACNSQPWKFIVINDAGIRERFAKEVFAGIYSATRFAAAAPVLVAVVSESGSVSSWIGGKIRALDFRLIDIGIACSHFALEAVEQGLGACILGWIDSKKAARILGVPSGRKVELIISVGYPAENPEARNRKTTEEISAVNHY